MKKYILLGLMCSIALFSSGKVYAKAKMVEIEVQNKSSRKLDYVKLINRGVFKNKKLFGIGRDLDVGGHLSAEIKQSLLRIKAIEVEYLKRIKDITNRYQFGTRAKPLNITNVKNLKSIKIDVYDNDVEIKIKVGKE